MSETTNPAPDLRAALAVYAAFLALDALPDQGRARSSYREGWQDGRNDVLDELRLAEIKASS